MCKSTSFLSSKNANVVFVKKKYCVDVLLDRFQSYVFFWRLEGEKKSSTFESYRRRCSFQNYKSLVKLDFRFVLVMQEM